MANTGLIQVVLETLRIASIISFTFREAVTDVEYKGKRGKSTIKLHFLSPICKC